MPSIAEQLRTAKRRRARWRLVAFVALVAVPAVALGARLAPGPAAELVGATSSTSTATGATGLHPGLVDAFERAQADAGAVGHRLTLTDGFRTPDEQAALLEAEVVERGSLEEARWWVFPPEQSMHVQGLAIDVGDGPAADWLAAEGARYGLCRTLAWEWWHFEWRDRWETAGACPAPATAPEDAPTA